MNKNKQIVEKSNRQTIVGFIRKVCNYLVFFGLVWTISVLFRLGDTQNATILALCLGLYMAMNKIESIDRFLKGEG